MLRSLRICATSPEAVCAATVRLGPCSSSDGCTAVMCSSSDDGAVMCSSSVAASGSMCSCSSSACGPALLGSGGRADESRPPFDRPRSASALRSAHATHSTTCARRVAAAPPMLLRANLRAASSLHELNLGSRARQVWEGDQRIDFAQRTGERTIRVPEANS
eukprot:scaffold85342_cov54-Phaeocystis_antarctica.AAC.2